MKPTCVRQTWCRCLVWLVVGLVTVMPAGRAQPLPDRRTLNGLVTRADGTPIGGAAISIRRQNENDIAEFWGAYAVSDARGRFVLPSVEDGAYYVDVDADGYAPERNLNFAMDANAAPLRITLSRLVPLTLHVLKPDGTSLAKTRVYMRITGEGPASQRFPAPVTDEGGNLRFDTSKQAGPEGINENPNCALCSLVPSRYLINILAPGVGFAVLRDLDVQFTENPKPVEARLQLGGTLHVTAYDDSGTAGTPGRPWGGAVLTMTPMLSDDAAARAAGKLSSPEDIGRFYTLQRDPSGASLVTRDGDGVVQLTDLPPATYRLRLFWPGQQSPDTQTVDLKPGQTTNADFRFRRTDNLSSLVVDLHNGQGQPLKDSDFLVQLRSLSRAASPSTGAVIVPPVPPEMPPGMMGVFFNGYMRRAHTDATGHFTLYPLPVGRWRVTVMEPYDPYDPARAAGPPAAQDVTITAQGGTASMAITIPAPTDRLL